VLGLIKKLIKKILLSTPVVLIFGLSVVVLGFILLFVGFMAVATYLEIFISATFVLFIAFVLMKYWQFRKPPLSDYLYTIESQKVIQAEYAKLWREESKYVLIFSLFVSTITVTNYWYGFITAPIVLILYGSFCILILYLSDKGPIDISQLNSAVSKLPGNVNSQNTSRTIINSFAILILVSGFWFYQIQKNESSQKETGYQTVLNLQDYRHCSITQNICGVVDSISNIVFLKERLEDGPGKGLKMCTNMTFKYSINESSYRKDWNVVEVCFKLNKYDNYFSEFESEAVVNAVLKGKIG